MEHPNAIAVRKLLAAMETGDLEAMDAGVTDDIVWHEIGGETKRGKAALRAEGTGADYDITFKVHDVVANDDHTIALGEATATRGDKPLNYRTAEIYHMKDGKIAERWPSRTTRRRSRTSSAADPPDRVPTRVCSARRRRRVRATGLVVRNARLYPTPGAMAWSTSSSRTRSSPQFGPPVRRPWPAHVSSLETRRSSTPRAGSSRRRSSIRTSTWTPSSPSASRATTSPAR